MKGTIKINGKPQAIKIIGTMAFTYEGAVETYKKMVSHLSGKMTMEAEKVLHEAEKTLHHLGYSWEEIEQFEIEAY